MVKSRFLEHLNLGWWAVTSIVETIIYVTNYSTLLSVPVCLVYKNMNLFFITKITEQLFKSPSLEKLTLLAKLPTRRKIIIPTLLSAAAISTIIIIPIISAMPTIVPII